MKIIMISLDKTLLSADYSGDVIERHKRYAEKVDSLDVIVFSKNGFQEKELASNFKVYPTNSISKVSYFWSAYKIAKKILKDKKPLLLPPLRKGRNKEGLSDTLIVTQEPFLTGLAGWLLKKKFKVPLLVHFHGDFWQNKYWLKESILNPIFLLISKLIIRKADGIRVVSSGIKEKLIKKGIKEAKIRVIPTPVDLEQFENFNSASVERIKKESYKNKVSIINAGRKDDSKNYNLLIKAIKLTKEQNRNFAFCQIGAGLTPKEFLENDEKTVFLFLDKVKQGELANYYHAADIYVSSSNHESFGKVLVEAMACGLPVVATATTGSKEIIKDGENGFLVPVGDADALADKIEHLLDSPETRREMGEKGRRSVYERFGRDEVIDNIVGFWKELMK